MKHYSREPRTRTYVKGHSFLAFAKNLSNTLNIYWSLLKKQD